MSQLLGSQVNPMMKSTLRWVRQSWKGSPVRHASWHFSLNDWSYSTRRSTPQWQELWTAQWSGRLAIHAKTNKQKRWLKMNSMVKCRLWQVKEQPNDQSSLWHKVSRLSSVYWSSDPTCLQQASEKTLKMIKWSKLLRDRPPNSPWGSSDPSFDVKSHNSKITDGPKPSGVGWSRFPNLAAFTPEISRMRAKES